MAIDGDVSEAHSDYVNIILHTNRLSFNIAGQILGSGPGGNFAHDVYR